MRLSFLLFAAMAVYCAACKKQSAEPVAKIPDPVAKHAASVVAVSPYPYTDTFLGRLQGTLDYDDGEYDYDNDSAYRFYVRHVSPDTISFITSRTIFAFSYEYSIAMYSTVYGTVRLTTDSLYMQWQNSYHHKGNGIVVTGGFVFENVVYAGRLINNKPR